MIDGDSMSGRSDGVREPLPQQLGELEARSAIELAQYGRLAQAGGMLLELRARYPMGQSARMAVWLLVLEAVLLQSARRNLEAVDRGHRALVLALAAGHPDLVAEAAVWLLSLDGLTGKPQRQIDAVRLGFQGFGRLGDEARSRLCLVVADVHQLMGQFDTAAPWYRRARAFSRRGGARPLMAAIEGHRLSTALQRLLFEQLAGLPPSDAVPKDWLEEIRSVQRLHQGLGVTAPDERLLLAEARAHQLRHDFAAAVQALMQVGPLRALHAFDGAGADDAALQLEIDWCCVRAGPATLGGAGLPGRRPSAADLASWPPAARVMALKQLDDIQQALDGPGAAPDLGPPCALALGEHRAAEAQWLPVLAACQAPAADVDRLLGAP